MEIITKTPYPDRIAVATNCLYTGYRIISDCEQRKTGDADGIRGDLAIELVERTIASGTRIVICDGGSSPEFISSLNDFNNHGLTVVNSDFLGRGPQRRSAFRAAIGLPNVEAVVYTQAEKFSLIDYLTEATQPIIDGRAEIVILGRNPELFEKSYPHYMWESELRVNKTYDWIMRRAGLMENRESFDWFFGPVVFRNDPEIVALFLKKYVLSGQIKSRVGVVPSPEMHSDGHYFPIIEALFNRKRVVSVEIPFEYPPLQKANELSPESIDTYINRRRLDAEAYRLEALHLLALLRKDPRAKIYEAKTE